MRKSSLLSIFLLLFSVGYEFLFVPLHHSPLLPFALYGFHALLGLAGSFLLICFAQGLAQKFLYRHKDYYDEH